MKPIKPESRYVVGIHKNGKYWYASTQPRTVDKKTGKVTYPRVHWGIVDKNLKFIPGLHYLYTPLEEREKLIFPSDWDLSEIEHLSKSQNEDSKSQNEDRMSVVTQSENLLYGDIWLMEKVIESTGLKEDLMKTFGGNKEIVDDILTVAMYLIVGKSTINQLVSWQRITKTLTNKELTSSVVTRLTQRITNQNRICLFQLRKNRLGPSPLCAVDSTSRSTYGKTLADIRWGKNKEKISLPQTVEVVVYSLSDHMPIYTRTFPGNMPDLRSFNTILMELENIGLENLIMITDRGYDSQKNLNELISSGNSGIMGVSTDQSLVLDNLPSFSNYLNQPESMNFDRNEKLFYCQKKLDYRYVDEENGNEIEATNLKLNIYFDLNKRTNDTLKLKVILDEMEEEIKGLLGDYISKKDEAILKKRYWLYKLDIGEKSRILMSYQINLDKYEQCIEQSGFFTSIIQNLDMDPMEVYFHYILRDEQEKYHTQMKSILGYNRVRVWSQLSKDGREFLQFVAQIILCRIKYIWKTKLSDDFCSVSAVLNEMRPIRYIQFPGSKPHVTAFLKKQIMICEAFGFEVPIECAPEYYIRSKKPKGKRGRPKKIKDPVEDN